MVAQVEEEVVVVLMELHYSLQKILQTTRPLWE
jgi:hypothetical protein